MRSEKLTIVVALCAGLMCTAARAETVEGNGEEEAKGFVEQLHEIFEAGVDVDFFSAYVWRNAVQNDEPVIQPCVWMDLTYFEPFWFGFSYWQNYDLTSRRHSVLRGGLTENDWNVHLGATVWESADETMSLDLEIGHEWYDNLNVKSEAVEDYKNTAELYVKATFENEFVTVYGMVNWMYGDFGAYKRGFNYELGFNREWDVAAFVGALPEETLVFGADWNLNFGDSHYLQFIYGSVDYREDEFGNERCSDPKAGIAGTTVKAYLTWNVTEWLSLVGTVAYTGVLNGSARQELANDCGWQGDPYRRDLLWGGLSLKFAF